ncbi:hypothetical protein [Streptomyces griseoruber]|uniref:hypothetical protein n=1 Tax=Streptomyces griseoruber TaxID=1943 RepID=UPI0037920C1A
MIARRPVSTVLAPDGGNLVDEEAASGPRDVDTRSAPGQAARPKPQVPVWRDRLAWSVLSVDYQRVLQALHLHPVERATRYVLLHLRASTRPP